MLHCILFSVCLNVLAAYAGAGDTALISGPPASEQVPWASWKCEYCISETDWSGEVVPGISAISGATRKSGQYDGLEDDGTFVAFDASLLWLPKDSERWMIDARNLGIDSRTIDMRGGHQGVYGLTFGYLEIPSLTGDGARTPFVGSGSGHLTLPAGWIRADTTAGMATLGESLVDADIGTIRRRFTAGFDWHSGEHWRTSVTLRSETRDGTDIIGGSFLTRAILLPEPVQYRTEQAEFLASYERDAWQLTLGYFVSLFENEVRALRFQNPFLSLAPGATTGELALPPTNAFHQFSLTTGWLMQDGLRLNAGYSAGHATQNEPFVASTLNPDFVVTMPNDSLDGEYVRRNGFVRLAYDVASPLTLRFATRLDVRDDMTRPAFYAQVVTDSFLAGERRNLPYGYRIRDNQVQADWRLPYGNRLTLDFEQRLTERELQQAARTREETISGEFHAAVGETAEMTLEIGRERRDGAAIESRDEAVSEQNPLLMKFHLADRDRDRSALSVSLYPLDVLSFGLRIARSSDVYPDSTLGLRHGKEEELMADASWSSTRGFVFSAYYVWQRVRYVQAGSQAFGLPDWSAHNQDSVHTGGVSLDSPQFLSRLSFNMEMAFSEATGETRLGVTDGNAAFPDTVARLARVAAGAKYEVDDDTFLKIHMRHERFRSHDWAYAGLDQDTIAGVLGLGELEPAYDVTILTLSFGLRF